MEILAFNYFFLGGGVFLWQLKEVIWQFAWMSMDISTRKQNVFAGDYSMTVLHKSKPFPGAIYQQSHVGSHREIEKKQNK